MYVIAQRRHLIDCLNNVVPEVAGMRGGKANPPDSRNLAHRGQQFCERPLPCWIVVGIYVLAQQLDFRITEIHHLLRLGENRFRRPAPLFPTSERYDAVGAELVAAFDDGDVSAMRIGARGELSLETLIGLTVIESGRALPCFDLYQHLRQVAVRGRSADQRNMRRPLKNPLPLLLSD